MSRQEIVTAYLDGGMSRRMFVRRLVAAGVSVGAAVSYAHLLDPQRAQARDARDQRADFYTPAGIQLVIKSKDLGRVVRKGKLRVEVGADEAATVVLVAIARVHGQDVVLGETSVTFGAAGSQLVSIPLTEAGREELGDRAKAKVTVAAQSKDLQGASAFAELTKKLK
jgi:hypothetical protein